MLLSEKVMHFLLMIKENGNKMTKGDQNLYYSVRYYMMMGYLSSNGLVFCNGVNDKNQKTWALTDKGMKTVDVVAQLQDVLHGTDVKELVSDGKQEKGKRNSARK
jgi:predicted transcriptional regulator